MNKYADALTQCIEIYFNYNFWILIGIIIAVNIIYYAITKKAKTLKMCICELYVAFVLHMTILARLPITYHPAASIWSGWGFLIGDFTDYASIGNLIMFLPVLMLPKFFKPDLSGKQLVLISSAVAFIFSLAIETIQSIANIGTFQIADIVYNTLSGFIGSAVYTVFKKHKEQKKNRGYD